MIHITSLDEGLETFKALGSEIRLQILNILLENDQMSMNQLASELNISNGALTGHIKKLEECGLISTSNESTGHGNQKMCSIIQDRIIVDIEKPIDYTNVFNTQIRVGQFASYNVCPARSPFGIIRSLRRLSICITFLSSIMYLLSLPSAILQKSLHCFFTY